MQYGTVDNSLQTADVNAVEVALANILANRALAFKNGEISHEKSKRMVKEQRFRHRLLKDAGLMEWPMENEQKFWIKKFAYSGCLKNGSLFWQQTADSNAKID